MVKWYLDFALSSSATTWSMEQVPSMLLTRLLRSYRLPGSPHRKHLDWDVFDFYDFGVPQHRKRLMAGSPHLIAKMRRVCKRHCAIRDFLPNPKGTHVRNSVSYGNKPKEGENKERKHYSLDESVVPVTGPAYTVISSNALRWATPYTNTALVPLTPRELSRLQAFPEGYKLHETKRVSIQGVGNALPPPVMTYMLSPVGRPVSPSLVWKPE